MKGFSVRGVAVAEWCDASKQYEGRAAVGRLLLFPRRTQELGFFFDCIYLTCIFVHMVLVRTYTSTLCSRPLEQDSCPRCHALVTSDEAVKENVLRAITRNTELRKTRNDAKKVGRQKAHEAALQGRADGCDCAA